MRTDIFVPAVMYLVVNDQTWVKEKCQNGPGLRFIKVRYQLQQVNHRHLLLKISFTNIFLKKGKIQINEFILASLQTSTPLPDIHL